MTNGMILGTVRGVDGLDRGSGAHTPTDGDRTGRPTSAQAGHHMREGAQVTVGEMDATRTPAMEERVDHPKHLAASETGPRRIPTDEATREEILVAGPGTGPRTDMA